MSPHIHGATIAAAAARQAQERLEREEEELTHYSDRDLADDWEFKIVRSGTAAFRKPQEFARLLEEEGRHGWVLLEKLDNSRVRFKRRAGSRPRVPLGDPADDPYRTNYKGSPDRQVAAAVAFGLGITVLFIALALLLAR